MHLKKYPTARLGGVYTQFTPDWYKRDFDAGPGLLFHYEVNVIVQRRLLPNKEGFEKMRLSIASYYELVLNFCKKALDYIVEHGEKLMKTFPHAAPTRRRRQQSIYAHNPFQAEAQNELSGQAVFPYLEEVAASHLPRNMGNIPEDHNVTNERVPD